MKRLLVILALVTTLAVAQKATTQQETKKHDMKNMGMDMKAMSGHEFMPAKDLQWGPPPPGLPAGGQMTVLSGDPGKAEEFIVRLKAPAGYTIPPHWHPTSENVTVISGEFHVGLGDKLDKAAAHAMKAGDFVGLPAKHNHYAFAKTDSVVQITAMGPFQITYVDAKDDPRTMKSTAKK